jgi:hypothetical protein
MIQLGQIKVLGLAIFPRFFSSKIQWSDTLQKRTFQMKWKKKKKTIPHIQNVLIPFFLF